jgi:ATP-dependent RNA helicase RhlE
MLPKQRQNLLFSATFSDEIKALADGLLHNPGFVEVARRNTASELVEQTVHMVPQAQKRELMSHLIKHHDWQQVLIFTRTKHGANRFAEKLTKDDIQAAAIHGNKSQGARTKALAQFKDGTMRVLVATDIAARGLDIDQLPQVVNFELPNVPEDYVHRIGRTGRAGSSGAAVSLVDREEIKLLKDIEKLIKREIPRVIVEGFTPSANPEPEAPRAPREPHAQKRKPQNTSNGPGQNARRNQGRGQTQAQAQAGTKPNTNSRPAKNNTSDEHLSEAARHQAMPQTSLFIPPSSPHRGNGNRNGQNFGNPGHSKPSRSGPNSGSQHRSGGRGR